MGIEKELGKEILESIKRRETPDTINHQFQMYRRILTQLEIFKKPYDSEFEYLVTHEYLRWAQDQRDQNV